MRRTSVATDQLPLPGLDGDEPAQTERARPRWSARAVAEALGQPPPTSEQEAVIECPPEPLLVVAGAGSGKTETMAARVVWLVANGLVEPERVLGLTFTRKAAGELADRVRTRLRQLRHHVGAVGGARSPGQSGDVADPTVSTYNSYAAAIVADHGLRLGVEPGSRLLGEAATWQLAHEVVQGWDVDLAAAERAPETIVQAVLSLAGQCSEHLVTPADLDAELARLVEHVGTLPADAAGGVPGVPRPKSELAKVLASVRIRRRLVPVVEAYLRRKRELQCLDFGDQVAIAARLAAQVPDVAATERARFGVVLLDEYQDTSHAQLVLLRNLFGRAHPVTAVGDPHQSIYGWRGASAGNLQTFPTLFPRRDGAAAPVANLSTSWRNDRAVLAVANVLASPLRDVATVEVSELTARPDAGAGEVVVRWVGTVGEEVEQLADDLAARWGRADVQAGGVAERGAEHQSMAVLCRRRSQFTAVEEALRARGVPVEVVGLGGLLDRPEVADVVATLQVLHDPSRGDAVMRLLTGPRWRIGPRDLVALAHRARTLARSREQAWRPPGDPDDGRAGADDVGPGALAPADAEVVDDSSLVEAIDDLATLPAAGGSGSDLSPEAHRRLLRFGAELARLRRRVDLPVPDLIGEVERTLLLDVELAGRPGTSPAAARAQLDTFVDVAVSFGQGADATLGGFLSWLAAAAARERGLASAEESDDPPEPVPGQSVEVSRTSVQLLTVHAAKGLEWDVVAVPGLVEGTFPAGSTSGGQDSASGWLTPPGAVPYDLRGDRDSLPRWPWRTVGDLAALEASRTAFRLACGAHEVAEERRLAYVAATRPRRTLLLSGYWWGDQKTVRTPSRFLREVVTALGADPAVRVEGATLEQLDDVPALPKPSVGGARQAPWPLDPLGDRRPAVTAAAEAVRAAAESGAQVPAAGGDGGGPAPVRSPWSAEVDRLLAERTLARAPSREVVLPHHLSASRAVQLADDPAALAAQLRRPMPSEPAPHTRRGTAFHAWMERRLRSAALVDLADLPGAGDDGAAPDDDLALLQAAFEASEWAHRRVLAVEVDVETPVGGIVLRGRIDAVFAAAGSRAGGAAERAVAGAAEGGAADGVDVVDWKTGRPPSGRRLRAAAVQLAVYRLAWSRLRGLPLDRVGAAFFYASTGTTLRPADDLGERDLVRLVESVVLVDPDPDREPARAGGVSG